MPLPRAQFAPNAHYTNAEPGAVKSLRGARIKRFVFYFDFANNL
jgi:hypothetical protein